ncbi:MAG: hypothetical protein H7138_15955 [Myxococcales bacterium]|nr:hypothetical protein [Myxococcales bacterium]
MVRLLLLASLLVGCRFSLEDEPEPVFVDRNCTPNGPGATCAAAAGKAELSWIQTNVFDINCGSGSCHGAALPEGGVDLRPGQSFQNLVNANSVLESSRKLVVPGNLEASYLMLMLGDYTPDMAEPAGVAPPGGYMPKGVPDGLCCQKLDAIQRWIMAGAMNN